MNHRIVSGVVVFITLVLCLAAALFAFAMGTGAPDEVGGQAGALVAMHPLDAEFADCRSCHVASGDNALSATHREFAITTCQTCHQALVAVAIPHPAGPGTQQQNCLACHTVGGVVPLLPAGHAGYDNNTCMHCHRLASGAAAAPTPAPSGDAARPARGIPHAVDDAYTTCTDCHQVDGNLPMPSSHDHYDVATCQDCHEPVDVDATATPGPTATPASRRTMTTRTPTPTPVATSSAP